MALCTPEETLDRPPTCLSACEGGGRRNECSLQPKKYVWGRKGELPSKYELVCCVGRRWALMATGESGVKRKTKEEYLFYLPTFV